MAILFAQRIASNSMDAYGFSDENRHSLQMMYWQKRRCNGYLHHHHNQINGVRMVIFSVILNRCKIYFSSNRLSIENLCIAILSFDKCKNETINSFGSVIFYTLSSIHSCQEVLSMASLKSHKYLNGTMSSSKEPTYKLILNDIHNMQTSHFTLEQHKFTWIGLNDTNKYKYK